jgi:hypothetical protein
MESVPFLMIDLDRQDGHRCQIGRRQEGRPCQQVLEPIIKCLSYPMNRHGREMIECNFPP